MPKGVYQHKKWTDARKKSARKPGRCTKKPGVVGLRGLYCRYRYLAKKKNKCFRLSLAQFKALTSSACTYCECEPKQISPGSHSRDYASTKTHGNYKFNGIDRKNSNKGYTKENCVPCCKWCNSAKNVMTEKEFSQHIQKLYKWAMAYENKI